MAPVLWVIAVLGNITVIHRMVFTYGEAKRLEEAQLRPVKAASSAATSTR
jgi:CDP-diacylglycerol--glycerol-3-phosphate 3-phosphatidyltransferase